MARARNIKPGFFTHDGIAELAPLARLLFIGLWTVADRAGRLEDRPKRIKAEVLPYDDCDINVMLQELHQAGFVQRYQAGNVAAIQIVNWDKHQNPHVKETESTIQAPDRPGASTRQESKPAGKAEQPGTEPSGLIPDSGFPLPDSNTSPNGEVDGPAQRAAPSPPPDFNGKNAQSLNGKAIVQIAGDWELPEDWGVDAEALGWKPSQVLYQSEKFRQYWTAGKGQGKRRSVKGWRQSWSNWLERAAKDQR
jgi:hypothetical protein